MQALVHEHLFCRNTKHSIGTDYIVPPYVEDVKLLDFTEVERGIYHSVSKHDTLRLRQLCCHSQISDNDVKIFGDEQKSLDEIRTLMISRKQTDIEDRKVKLATDSLEMKVDAKMYDMMDRKRLEPGETRDHRERQRALHRETLQGREKALAEQKRYSS